VEDFLSAFFSYVELEFVTCEISLLSKFFGCNEKMAEEWLLLLSCIGYGWDVLSWRDDDMCGVLRMNIGEGDAFFVLILNGGRNLFQDDFAEEAVGGHRYIM